MDAYDFTAFGYNDALEEEERLAREAKAKQERDRTGA